jgi:hypothetical protein
MSWAILLLVALVLGNLSAHPGSRGLLTLLTWVQRHQQQELGQQQPYRDLLTGTLLA